MGISYGNLSTYPPTQCGLATFSSALVESLRATGDPVGVVSVVDTREAAAPVGVSHQWVRSQAGGAAAAAAALNRFDVAIIQHEYGIYGGRDGADVLEVVRALWVPPIVVLHTVLETPTDRQRSILEELSRLAATVVTMTRTARDRLVRHYSVDPRKVRVVPHGAVDNRAPLRAEDSTSAPVSPTILTWGLLGEGKGIEWAIEAMALIGDLQPAPTYRVVGQTHPRVLERLGDVYRESLVGLARERGVTDAVQFDARYLSSAELRSVVRQADVVLLPYDSKDQVTSGVLIEAIAAGKPVISTKFPHARELLDGGAGLLVDRQDPAGIAAALRRVLTEPGLARTMRHRAHTLAPELLWPAVAAQYQTIAATALAGTESRATA